MRVLMLNSCHMQAVTGFGRATFKFCLQLFSRIFCFTRGEHRVL